MGGEQKLLVEWQGKPLLAHAADALLASRIASLHVVVGADAPALRAALAGRALDIVENPAHAEGMAASLRAGTPPTAAAIYANSGNGTVSSRFPSLLPSLLT